MLHPGKTQQAQALSERPKRLRVHASTRTHTQSVEQCVANPLSQAVQVTQSQKRKKNQKERRETDRSPHYLVVFVLVGDLQRLHGLDHGLHGGEDVLVDQPGEASLVLIRVSAAMDDPHLLDESALATFPSACSRHTHTQTLVNTPTEKELSHHVPLRRKRKQKVFCYRQNQYRIDFHIKNKVSANMFSCKFIEIWQWYNEKAYGTW